MFNIVSSYLEVNLFDFKVGNPFLFKIILKQFVQFVIVVIFNGIALLTVDMMMFVHIHVITQILIGFHLCNYPFIKYPECYKQFPEQGLDFLPNMVFYFLSGWVCLYALKPLIQQGVEG